MCLRAQLVPLTLVLAGLPGPAQAVPEGAVKLEWKQDLNFGNLVPGDGSGSLALDPSGHPRPEGLTLVAGTAAPATLRLSGPPGQPFTVKLPVRVPAAHGSGVAWVDQFQAAIPGQELAFNGAGKADLKLGGTLRLPPGTPQGPLALPPVELVLDCAGASMTFIAPMKGRVMVPIQVKPQGGPMTFGQILSPRNATLVRVDPGGDRTVLGEGDRTILLSGMPTRAGVFQVKGEPEERISVTLPAEAELHGPRGAMKIVNFQSDVPKEGKRLSGGKATVQVGATLLIQAGQPPGTYTGYYTVMFDYQ